jgi:hypothetical protein
MRTAFAVLLVFFVLLAGCSGSPGGSAETPVTERTGVTNTSSLATAENTVAFENLTDGEREAFLDARDGAVSLGPASCDGVYANVHRYVFEAHEYVRYDGQYYEATIEWGDRRWGANTYEMERSDPPGSATVVSYGDLSSEAKRAVNAAFGGRYSRYTAPYCGDAPDVITAPKYVRYENETYVADSVGHRDVAEQVLRVTEYGDDGSDGH